MKLLRIEEIEKQDEYWDLEVENTNNLFANDILVHNSNAGLSFHKDELYAQSKKNVITVEQDNAGFAFFVKTKELVFKQLIDVVRTVHGIDTDNNIVSIMGEWFGKGIQSGVAVNELDKKFAIFGIKVRPLDEEIPSYWIEHNIFPYEYVNEHNIYVIDQFKTFDILIDFENPLMSQNKMVDMVMEVEKECPVGKFFGVSGIELTKHMVSIIDGKLTSDKELTGCITQELEKLKDGTYYVSTSL